MKITDCLSPERILFLDNPPKAEVVNQLVNALATAPAVTDAAALRKAIFAREKILSTGIGLGIAVPHAKIPEVTEFVISVGLSTKGVEFDAIDAQPANVIVMIAGPDGQQDRYLKLLAHTTLTLKNAKNRNALLAAGTSEAVWNLLNKERCQNG